MHVRYASHVGPSHMVRLFFFFAQSVAWHDHDVTHDWPPLRCFRFAVLVTVCWVGRYRVGVCFQVVGNCAGAWPTACGAHTAHRGVCHAVAVMFPYITAMRIPYSPQTYNVTAGYVCMLQRQAEAPECYSIHSAESFASSWGHSLRSLAPAHSGVPCVLCFSPCRICSAFKSILTTPPALLFGI